MKKSQFLIASIFLSVFFTEAQETLYVMKDGNSIAEYNITTEVDSIVFYNPSTTPISGTDPATLGPLKLVVIGDSITHGSNNQMGAYYRKPLWYLLKAAGFDMDFLGSENTFAYGPFNDSEKDIDLDWDRDHEAKWGIQTNAMASQLVSRMSNYAAPDIALIHLGSNDFNNADPVIAGYDSIIDDLRAANPDVVIFLAYIIKPNHGGVMAMINDMKPKLPGYVAGKTTTQSPIITVDLFTGFETLPETGRDFDTYISPDAPSHLTDAFHPNWRGANRMAAQWFDAITSYYGVESNETIFCTHKGCVTP